MIVLVRPRLLILQLSLIVLISLPPPSLPSFFGGDPFGGCCTTEEPTTTQDPCCTTTNGYNAAGWETDDDGNVFIGDDDAKLFLIQMPAQKYWSPIPKDWPEALIHGSQFPDSPYYRRGCESCYPPAPCDGCG